MLTSSASEISNKQTNKQKDEKTNNKTEQSDQPTTNEPKHKM
jgi:hypothetical protein